MAQQIDQPGQQNVVIIQKDSGHPIILRFIWMIFIGWWLSAVFYITGAFLTLLIVTAPLGMLVMQKLGWAFSLYSESSDPTIIQAGNTTIIMEAQQTSFIIRFIYFIVIGWWVGFIAMIVAWLLGVIIVGLPLSIMIMNRMGKIMTLAT